MTDATATAPAGDVLKLFDDLRYRRIPTNFFDVINNRNALLDRLFYNTSNLSEDELAMLLSQRNDEGSILVVSPSDRTRKDAVRKFEDFASFRAAPGELLQRFVIAGVGSSDIGAAAFARSVANRYDTPVGAIVAGYGIADLMTEALGGWFVLGAANRMLDTYQRFFNIPGSTAPADKPLTTTAAPRLGGNAYQSDTQTLLRLLREPERNVVSVAGHSKGCLSIAYAMNALALGDDEAALERARQTRVVTVGAVTAFPTGFNNCAQYIGDIDWFGGMNSRLKVPHTKVDKAWHHLNTELPYDLDFDAVLAGEPD
ncbi:hypothetical protein [Roseibium sp.]|uniref:hypothetical protein n=1 Tax=Roseibium sp. TaxID=1936156 RepID=UPI003BAC1987